MGKHRASQVPIEVHDPYAPSQVTTRFEARNLVRKKRAPLPAKVVVTVVLAAALTAASFGVTSEPKGAATATPLTTTAPAPEAVPDTPMVEPPVLTPSLPHSHRSRALRPTVTSQVLSTAQVTPEAIPQPETVTQTRTVHIPEMRVWDAQPSYPTPRHHSQRDWHPQQDTHSQDTTRHHHTRDIDQDGDSK